MSSIGEAQNVTASTQRTEEDYELMESDAMSEPTINLSDGDKDEVNGSKSQGRPISIVWRHFDQVTRKGQLKPDRAKCKYCKSDYKWLSGNGTSTLKKHMQRCSKNPENIKAKRQKTIASYAKVKGGCDESGLGTWKFDQKACRDALARMILMDELAFRFVERDGVRAFCRVLQPLFKEVSRVTVARDCVDLYASEKIKIKNLFRKSNQRVCLTSVKGAASLESKFQKQLEEEDDGGKLELDRYLDERCQKKIPNFNILEWWKVNAVKYPVLSEIARDAIAIPVSTVASEAAFSTRGRVIDQFRSSLSPKLVECLICKQDWLRATPLPFEVEENTEEMQELELALQKVSIHPIPE